MSKCSLARELDECACMCVPVDLCSGAGVRAQGWGLMQETKVNNFCVCVYIIIYLF